jgi:hypothetical protein
MEPQWTKQIPSDVICNTYYGFFIVYAIMGAITLLGTIGILSYFKMPKFMAVSYGFYGLLVAVLAFVMSLFQYLVCSRALLGEQVVTIKKEAPQQ